MLKRMRRVLIESDIEVSFRRRMRSRYYRCTQTLLQPPPTTCAHRSRAGRPPSHRFKFALRRETIVIESDQRYPILKRIYPLSSVSAHVAVIVGRLCHPWACPECHYYRGGACRAGNRRFYPPLTMIIKKKRLRTRKQ